MVIKIIQEYKIWGEIKNIEKQNKRIGVFSRKNKFAVLFISILITVLAGALLVSAAQSTKLSLHGKATDAVGDPIDNSDLGVNISTSSSCTSDIIFNEVYANEIQDGIYDVLLGDSNSLDLNYNQDYYMCVYVDNELVSGPDKFVGGHGEISGFVSDTGDTMTGNLLISSANITADYFIGNGSQLTDVGGMSDSEFISKLNTNRTGGDVYFSEKVGIGTSLPSSKLQVNSVFTGSANPEFKV